jgi:hypothetical protein
MKLFRARISVGPQSLFTVTVVSVERGHPVWDAHVLVSRDLDDRMMWQGRTNEDGIASNLMPYIGDHKVRVQVIKAGYLPVEFRRRLMRAFDAQVQMQVDTTHHFASYSTAFTSSMGPQ